MNVLALYSYSDQDVDTEDATLGTNYAFSHQMVHYIMKW